MGPIALLVVVGAVAQIAGEPTAAPTEPLVLDIGEALRRAEARSETVGIAAAGVRRAQADQTRAFSEWLPQASANLSYDRTLATEFDDIEFPAAPGGDSALTELPFGRENIWRAGLSISQNLFAGGRTVALQRVAAAGHRVAGVGLKSARAQAVLDAAQAYYDAVLAERLVEIAEQSLGQAQLIVEQTQLGVRNGTMPDFDLLRAQVALENQKPPLLQRRTDLQTARLRLKQLLDIDPERVVVLSSPLDGALVDVAPLALAAAPEAATPGLVRAPVRQAQEAKTQREAAVDVAWAQHLPQIDVGMSYGLVNYPDKLTPDFDDLRDNWTVGVGLRVPLFTGFRISADVDSARADVADADERLQQALELARFEARTAAAQVATSQAAFAATAGVVEQAKRALSIAQLRFSEGISTQLERRDAQLLLDQAEVNRASAARDLQIAKARLALLPSLPGAPTGAFTGAAGSSSFTLPSSSSSSFSAMPQASSSGATGISGAGGATSPSSTGTGFTPGLAPPTGSATSPSLGF